MADLYGDDFELLLDECESNVIVDFVIFPLNDNLEEEKHKIAVPKIEIKQEPEYCFDFHEESTHINFKEEPISDDIKEEFPSNLSNLLEEALQLNHELQKDFEGILYGFKETLRLNYQKQNELEVEIIALRKRISGADKTEHEKRVNKRQQLSISYFGAPYFKSNLVLERIPPMNADVDIARKLNLRPIIFPSKRIKMTDCEEIKLHEAVKSEVIRLALELKLGPEQEKLEKKLAMQKEKGRGTRSTEMLLAKLKQRISSLGQDEHELFKDSTIHRIDLVRWDLIAYVIFPNKFEYTGEFLRLWWTNYLRSDLLKGEKSTKEKQALKTLLANVDLNRGVSWSEIAIELARKTKSKLQRPAFDCFSYFQRRLNNHNRIFGWSKEDDAKLTLIFNQHVYVDSNGLVRVDWEGIRPHFLGRSVAQMWSHLKYSARASYTFPNVTVSNVESGRKQVIARKAKVATKLKPRGRPSRVKIPLEDELQQLLRPMGIFRQYRQRVMSLPGDGRRNGPVLAALCRLLGVQFDTTKLPNVEKGAWNRATIDAFYASGIEEKDLHSYRVLLDMIAEFPIEHDTYNARYLSGETPPPESLLPPSLHTLAGLRGLLLWSESVAHEVEEKFVKLEKVEAADDLYEATDVDIEDLKIEDVFGDPEADKQLLFFLESIFGLTGEMACVW
ncbi:uncharacterized protein LOC130695172 [Daphnia carinata]|uniref:uncharacterized protein LOC130695172 n=1 Tax=Daphnia carinata TaxID=120202 RepID=UPI002869087C|nr:uncharacterized protein LOC130695172 [Daphnia carinata]